MAGSSWRVGLGAAMQLRLLAALVDQGHRCSGAFAAYAAFQWQIGARGEEQLV